MAEGEAIVLANDDAVYEPDFVGQLIGALDPEAGVMMAAGALRADRAPGVLDTAGIEIDRTLLAFDYLHGRPVEILERELADPFGPSGAAAAYDRAAFVAMGGFDEQIFAYFEDLDLALRMRLAGWTCRLAAGARGSHQHAATLGSGSRQKNYLMGFARGYLLRKWGVISPDRAIAVAARELAICSGQAVVDKNLQCLRGRIDGWSRATPAASFPAALVKREATLTLRDSLGQRLRRRVRPSGLAAPDRI